MDADPRRPRRGAPSRSIVAGVALLAVAALAAVAIGLRGGPGPTGTAGPSSPPPVAVGSAGATIGPAASATSSVLASPTGSPVRTAPATPRPTAAPAPPTAAPTARPVPTPRPGGWPAIGHIYEIVFENHSAGAIIGNPSAPYLNSLARSYGLATNYSAVAHPSEPNYFALWSGSTQGVKDDAVYNFTSGTTLADEIERAGLSWHVAAQNVPLGCYTGASASGGEDGSGTYARKHEPAISWTSVSGNPARCARITDFRHFDPAVGNFWFIVPNLCNDMHDCPVATGDAWLKGFLPRILGSAAFRSGGLVAITFDEGSGSNTVATILVGPSVRRGFTSSTPYTHYSLLRTIQDVWGLRCLVNSCPAHPMREFFA